MLGITDWQNKEAMTLNPSIPCVDSTQMQYMKLIDLNNYYRDIREQEVTHCQICKLSIAKHNVFEHSISKRHKYNKLLFCIAQDRSYNVDTDLIVLNIDRLQCRYCKEKINSDEGDLVIINHIQDIRHIRRRQDHLDGRVTGIRDISGLLKPLDALITYAINSKQHTKKKDKTIAMGERLLEESKQSKNEVRDMKNVDQSYTLQYSGFSKDYESEEEGELRSAIGEGVSCICRFCFLSRGNGINFVIEMGIRRGLDCKKYRRSMLLEGIATTVIKTDVISDNFLPQCATTSNDKISESGIKLPDNIIIREKGIPTCKICVTEVPNTLRDIHLHVNGKKHKQALEVEQGCIPNFMSIVKKGNRHCAICLIKVLNNSTSINDHIGSKKHKKAMMQSMSKSLEMKDVVQGSKKLEWEALMTPQDIREPTLEPLQVLNFPKTKEIITKVSPTHNNDRHSLSQHSVTSNEEELQSRIELPDCMSIIENGAYMCTPCRKEVPRTISNITEHINGKKHKQRMVEIKESEDQKSKLQVKKISLPISVLLADTPILPSTIETRTYMCLTCLISIPNDEVSIKEHKDCETHSTKILELEMDIKNSIYLIGKNASNYISLVDNHPVCKLCRIFLPEHSLITDHLNSREHGHNVLKTPAPICSTVHVVAIDDVWACKICHTLISTLEDVHVKTKKHQAMMQRVDERLIGYEDIRNLWVCKICRKLYPKSKQYMTHIHSDKHIRNVEAFLNP